MAQVLRCKVGDLAVVVSATLSQNIGQIVEVLGRQRRGKISLKKLGHIWHVKALSGRPSLQYLFASGDLVQATEGPVPDFRMVPVSGLPDVDGQLAQCGIGKASNARQSPSVAAVAALARDPVASPLSCSVSSDVEQRA